MSKFKKGARVRVFDHPYLLETDTGTVVRKVGGDECRRGSIVVAIDDYMELSFKKRELELIEDERVAVAEREQWVPKIGDRVRVIDDVGGGKIGDVCVVTSINDSVFDDDEYYCELDGLSNGSMGLYARRLAPFTIEAGKFYRTRDGRKVGPMVANDGTYDHEYPFMAPEVFGLGFAPAWRSDGTFHPNREPTNGDLVAEWVDEPVAAPKFKVGDIVNYVFDGEVIHCWDRSRVIEVKADGVYRCEHPDMGVGSFCGDCLILVTPAPAANDNTTLTVTLKLDSEPLADAFRTIAAALDRQIRMNNRSRYAA